MGSAPHRDVEASASIGHEDAPLVEIIECVYQLGVGTGPGLRPLVGFGAYGTENEPEEIRLVDSECDVRATKPREARTRRVICVTGVRCQDQRHTFIKSREPTPAHRHE